MHDVQGLPPGIFAIVGVGQPIGHFGHDVHRDLDGDPFAARGSAINQRAKRFAVDELERDVVAACRLAEVDNARDVPVLELARDARLVLEELEEFVVRGDTRKDALERDRLVGTVPDRPEHLGHAADADPVEEGVRAETAGGVQERALPAPLWHKTGRPLHTQTQENANPAADLAKCFLKSFAPAPRQGAVPLPVGAAELPLPPVSGPGAPVLVESPVSGLGFGLRK